MFTGDDEVMVSCLSHASGGIILKKPKERKLTEHDGGGVCEENELQSLQFSISETRNFILIQGAVKKLQGEMYLKSRTAIF